MAATDYQAAAAQVDGGSRSGAYWLDGVAEVDDAYIGERESGRGAEGRTVVLMAVEKRGVGAGFMAAKAVAQLNQGQVAKFAERIALDAVIRSCP